MWNKIKICLKRNQSFREEKIRAKQRIERIQVKEKCHWTFGLEEENSNNKKKG